MRNNPFVRRFLSLRPIAWFPVRVRGGIADGAKWTFFPWSAYWRGKHEPEVQARLLKMGDWRGRHVWDLGSHYGLFAVGLGLRVGPTGSVAAFEPNPLSFRRLAHHVKRNALSWVKTFPYALSAVEGTSRFIFYGGMETTSSHLAYDGETWDQATPSVEVSLRRLDDLVARGEIALPDFVKVDVEGHAHKALDGARRSLAASRPVLLIGLHSEEEIRGTLAVLTPLGYQATPLLPDAPAQPTSGYDYLFEPLGSSRQGL